MTLVQTLNSSYKSLINWVRDRECTWDVPCEFTVTQVLEIVGGLVTVSVCRSSGRLFYLTWKLQRTVIREGGTVERKSNGCFRSDKVWES